MQKLLPALLAALLALCASAVPAQALSLPLPPASLVAPDEEAEDAETGDESESDEGEEAEEDGCTIEDEEDVQLCAEIAEEEREAEQARECVVEDATAKVAANPGNGTVSLVVRYHAFAPTAVAIDARLRGGKGGVHLGADHTRFRRAGTFRDTFALGEKRMERVLAARQFEVELQAVNAPRYCRLELNGALRRAKRSLRAGGRDRSGGPGRTRGK
ncbi:MAG TPA: hypothetical protein VFY75_01870 [Solirubrobacterales bacterium]|nr:hypothetical protein [Solirubrobacterales bacterium]